MIYDVVFFWKQNDTDLYQRRHDVFMHRIANSKAFGRVLQFDAPISIDKLKRDTISARLRPRDQYGHTTANTIGRWLGCNDSASTVKRTFIYSKKANQRLMGVVLPPIESYVEWVQSEVISFRSTNPLLAWVCPVVADFPAIQAAVNFDMILADIIDDQRTMLTDQLELTAAENNYKDVLALSDIVIANSQSTKQSFSSLRSDIHAIPNGLTISKARSKPLAVRKEICSLGTKIIGYVGNLRDRIDVDLIDKLAKRHPDWAIVLIGSAHGNPDSLRLSDIHNIHFLGVRRAREAEAYIRCFDVAIVPHMNNAISAMMCPLKIYTYLSLGSRVVTTRIANISEVESFIAVASDHEDFIRRVEHAAFDSMPMTHMDTLPSDLSWANKFSLIEKLVRDFTDQR